MVVFGKRVFVAIALTLFCGFGYAQLESTWWYFGLGAGLSFESGQSVADTASITSSNGAVTMSDSVGNLLFYFGFENDYTGPSPAPCAIWNKNHEYMQNGDGLFSEGASEQSSVAVPRPLSNHEYYVFTSDNAGVYSSLTSVGLFYHLIDMELDGGLGGVVPGQKNIVLMDSTSEKIAATPHANGVDYWVTVQQCGSNKFHSFLVTSAGVNPTPVTSEIVPFAGFGHCTGSLRFHPEGNMLVDSRGDLILMQFDNATGVLSNEIVLTGLSNLDYGTEFSPDGTKMYVGGPWQFDVSIYDSTSIMNSAVLLANFLNGTPTTTKGLQMGLDGKIYGINWALWFDQNGNIISGSNGYMSVINYPNESGAACGYQDSAVYLEGRYANVSVPNFPSNFFKTDFTTSGRCAGDTVFFDVNFHFINNAFWNFGDPASGAANTSTLVDAWHIYENPGTYTVTLIAQNGAKTDTIVKKVHIKPKPQISLGPDREFCAQNDSVKLSAGGLPGAYLWSTGSTDSTLWASQSGSYALTFTTECGSDTDSINITASLPLSLKLPADTTLCADSFLIIPEIQNENGFTKFLWNTGDTTRNHTAVREGLPTLQGSVVNHSLTVANICGKDSADITITFLPKPDGFLPNDSIYCLDDAFYLLNPHSAGISYVWNDSSTGPQYRLDSSGTYWLKSMSACDTLLDSFTVVFNGEPKVQLMLDTALCPGEEVRLQNIATEIPADQTYLWSTTSTDSAITITMDSSQTYRVTATLRECATTDSVRLHRKGYCPERCKPDIPNIITPNADGHNDFFGIRMQCAATQTKLNIYNRWGQLVYSGSTILSWDGHINGSPASEGTYYYVFSFTDESNEKRSFRGYVTVVR